MNCRCVMGRVDAWGDTMMVVWYLWECACDEVLVDITRTSIVQLKCMCYGTCWCVRGTMMVVVIIRVLYHMHTSVHVIDSSTCQVSAGIQLIGPGSCTVLGRLMCRGFCDLIHCVSIAKGALTWYWWESSHRESRWTTLCRAQRHYCKLCQNVRRV